MLFYPLRVVQNRVGVFEPLILSLTVPTWPSLILIGVNLPFLIDNTLVIPGNHIVNSFAFRAAVTSLGKVTFIVTHLSSFAQKDTRVRISVILTLVSGLTCWSWPSRLPVESLRLSARYR